MIHFLLGLGAEINAEGTYRSGYPSVTGCGVAGCGFPFWWCGGLMLLPLSLISMGQKQVR